MTRQWECPFCDQTSERKWNLKVHLNRKHDGLGQPAYMSKTKEGQYGSINGLLNQQQPPQRSSESGKPFLTADFPRKYFYSLLGRCENLNNYLLSFSQFHNSNNKWSNIQPVVDPIFNKHYACTSNNDDDETPQTNPTPARTSDSNSNEKVGKEQLLHEVKLRAAERLAYYNSNNIT
jgi:hypothetical protein